MFYPRSCSMASSRLVALQSLQRMALRAGSLAGLGSLVAAAIYTMSAQAQMFSIPAQVVQVIGGTEVLVEISGELFTVNLAYQFVPPELGQAGEQAATQALNQLLPADSWIQIDPVQIGSGNRIYGFVYNETGLVNAQLLAFGHTVAPWRLPNTDLQQWHDGAVAQAQALGLGMYAQPLPMQAQAQSGWQQMGQELRNPSSPLLPSILGTSLMVMILAVVGVRQWQRPRSAPNSGDPALPKDPRQLRTILATAIATQKTLESRYQEAQHQVELWLERAKKALIHQDEPLARAALIRKRDYAQSAQDLRRALDDATAQVVALQSAVHQRQKTLR